jgi:hypothetical protein
MSASNSRSKSGHNNHDARNVNAKMMDPTIIDVITSLAPKPPYSVAAQPNPPDAQAP